MAMYPYPFHGHKPPRGQIRVPRSRLYEGRFGRLFRKLSPAPTYGATPEENLAAVTQLADSMRDVPPAPEQPQGWNSPGAPADTGDNGAIPSAYTYFGQFVDHDITFDPTSQLAAKNDPDALHSFRSPRFDLDSLYGSGPIDEPFQYDRERHLDEVPDQQSPAARFLIGANEAGEEDLPRTQPVDRQGVAIIGDPRNDENTIVSQLQLAFLKLHNRFVGELDRADGRSREARFAEVQQLVRWHYQWVVVLDYLPKIIGEATMAKVWPRWEVVANLDGETKPDDLALDFKWYRPKNNPFMPVEFSVAAYRMGHSMVRPAYHLNTVVQDKPIFAPGNPGPLGDLGGFRTLPGQWGIEWERFLPIGDPALVQPSRQIDAKIAEPLYDLPQGGGSLAKRNLLRGQALQLPSGQDVARLLGHTVRSGAELGTELDPTPLWFYLLKEAELDAGGSHLGQTGALIVAEVILGLLALDPTSWINRQPQEPVWRPTIAHAGERLTLGDLIAFARG